MKEEKSTKISLTTAIFLIIITVMSITIIILGTYIYLTSNNYDSNNNVNNEAISQAQTNINSEINNQDTSKTDIEDIIIVEENTVIQNFSNEEVADKDIKDKEDTNSAEDIKNDGNDNNTNSSEKNNNTINAENNIDDNDLSYTFEIKDELTVIVKANKNGKAITKKIQTSAEIAKTGVMEITNVGKVALVSETGGEFYCVNIYQLVGDEIREIGNIDYSADTVINATYKTEIKDEDIAIIKATANGKTITKEIEMSAAIHNINTINVFGLGEVVLIAETGGEYYGIKAYRLTSDYISGKILGIEEVGTIENPNLFL